MGDEKVIEMLTPGAGFSYLPWQHTTLYLFIYYLDLGQDPDLSLRSSDELYSSQHEIAQKDLY
jgi:hypothetical protein